VVGEAKNLARPYGWSEHIGIEDPSPPCLLTLCLVGQFLPDMLALGAEEPSDAESLDDHDRLGTDGPAVRAGDVVAGTVL